MREKDERERAGHLWKGESSRAQHGYVHRLDKVATSFFFTNFPEEVKAIDLWPRFAKYGRVVAKPISSRDGKTPQGRSFKSALIDADEVRRKTGGVAEVVTPVVVPEVVWEVEVEEDRLMKLEGAYVGYLVEDRDIQAIQNNLRMDGYNGLNVTAMGHLMVLLWSDRVGEVKEVVETVGGARCLKR
jgi:hypothetical protein